MEVPKEDVVDIEMHITDETDNEGDDLAHKMSFREKFIENSQQAIGFMCLGIFALAMSIL